MKHARILRFVEQADWNVDLHTFYIPLAHTNNNIIGVFHRTAAERAAADRR